jgi:hypothetical protein
VGVTDYQFNALADQLRRLELRTVELERRRPVADAIPWAPVFSPALPASTGSGYYVRLNGIVVAWAELTFTAAAVGGIAIGDTLSVELPVPVETLVGGSWLAWLSATRRCDGVFRNAVGDDQVYFQYPPLGDELQAISSKGVEFVDLSASLTAGTVQKVDVNWSIGDVLAVNLIARMPPGS